MSPSRYEKVLLGLLGVSGGWNLLRGDVVGGVAIIGVGALLATVLWFQGRT